MEITGAQVMELRKKTGAGVADCKKALVETNGDIEKAVNFLREKVRTNEQIIFPRIYESAGFVQWQSLFPYSGRKSKKERYNPMRK